MSAGRDDDTTTSDVDPIADAVRRAVEQAPPLSPEQRDRLRGLLREPAPRLGDTRAAS